jgi:hypothetical protein
MKWALKRQRDQTFTVAFGNLTKEQAAALLLAAAQLAKQEKTNDPL